jgi:hypothetical protein
MGYYVYVDFASRSEAEYWLEDYFAHGLISEGE